MEFRIADTFTNSLSRLTGEEQKLVKTTAFDLQMNPANPGHNFHRSWRGAAGESSSSCQAIMRRRSTTRW